jgi:hypothetical protein
MIEEVVTGEMEPSTAVKETSEEILNLMDQGE